MRFSWILEAHVVNDGKIRPQPWANINIAIRWYIRPFPPVIVVKCKSKNSRYARRTCRWIGDFKIHSKSWAHVCNSARLAGPIRENRAKAASQATVSAPAHRPRYSRRKWFHEFAVPFSFYVKLQQHVVRNDKMACRTRKLSSDNENISYKLVPRSWNWTSLDAFDKKAETLIHTKTRNPLTQASATTKQEWAAAFLSDDLISIKGDAEKKNNCFTTYLLQFLKNEDTTCVRREVDPRIDQMSE